MRTELPMAETMAEASVNLLGKALNPQSWGPPLKRVTINNTCQVGSVQVCATIDVMPTLETNLRISFRGPSLSPMEAAELLEQFTASRFTFVPNAEWFVEIDARRWIHFSRPYTGNTLQA